MAAGDRIFMAKESTSQEILSNTKKIIEDAKAKPKRYGMRINLLDSNPATRVKYLYDAVGMTPAGMNFAGGGFDYGTEEHRTSQKHHTVEMQCPRFL